MGDGLVINLSRSELNAFAVWCDEQSRIRSTTANQIRGTGMHGGAVARAKDYEAEALLAAAEVIRNTEAVEVKG